MPAPRCLHAQLAAALGWAGRPVLYTHMGWRLPSCLHLPMPCSLPSIMCACPHLLRCVLRLACPHLLRCMLRLMGTSIRPSERPPCTPSGHHASIFLTFSCSPFPFYAVFYPMALYETAHSPPRRTRLLMYATSGFMLAVCILATVGSFYAFTQV